MEPFHILGSRPCISSPQRGFQHLSLDLIGKQLYLTVTPCIACIQVHSRRGTSRLVVLLAGHSSAPLLSFLLVTRFKHLEPCL
jgi:hypothetical protein